jgi:hypothetical protein
MLGAAGVGMAAAATAAGDTDDHFNKPAGTVVSGSGTFKGTGVFGGVPITINCTSVKASGKVPASGLSVTLGTAPKITSCTDTLGGTDTITNSGTWKIKEIDVSNDEAQKEPNTGDKGAITIPKAGSTFKSTLDPACVVTVAPNGPVTITGTYNDVKTLKISGATVPVMPSASCPSGTGTTAKVSTTITLSPNPLFDVS